MADDCALDGGVITPEDVRGWVAREAPRWPALAVADVLAIATACDMERQAEADTRGERDNVARTARRDRGDRGLGRAA